MIKGVVVSSAAVCANVTDDKNSSIVAGLLVPAFNKPSNFNYRPS